MVMSFARFWNRRGERKAQPLRKRATPTKKKPTTRPTLEALEDRMVMSTLPSVEATPIFLGPYWQSSWDGIFLSNATQAIVNSPYMDALQNAGYGVGRGHLSMPQTWALSNVVAGTTPVTDQQVHQYLVQDVVDMIIIQAWTGQSQPLPDANRLYEVFLPPGVTFTASNGMYSSQSNLTGWNGSFSSGVGQINYVVIPYQGGTNLSANGKSNINAFTEIMSHEIAEAVTGQPDMADSTQWFHYQMSNGVAIELVNQFNNPNRALSVPGATPLQDIEPSEWGQLWHA